MKSVKVIIVAVILCVLISAFAGCSAGDVKYGAEYQQIYFNSEEGKFVPLGITFTMKDNYTYKEAYTLKDDSKVISGNFVDDNLLGLYYLRANDSSFDSFRREYRKELKQLGYTTSEIDNIILPSIAQEGELFKYKDYLFKVGSINAAKCGDAKSMNVVDGTYSFTGLLSESDKEMKLDMGNIYIMKYDEFGEKTYNDKIGEYSIDGDIITIKPLVALDEGKDVSKPMKYLLADIELPLRYEDNKDENGKYNDNSVITVTTGVKVKVIVGSFYTNKDIK